MNMFVRLKGRLGCDPIVQEDKRCVQFSLAVDIVRKEEKTVLWCYCIGSFDVLRSRVQYLRKGKAMEIMGDVTGFKHYVNNNGTPGINMYVKVVACSFLDSIRPKQEEAPEEIE